MLLARWRDRRDRAAYRLAHLFNMIIALGRGEPVQVGPYEPHPGHQAALDRFADLPNRPELVVAFGDSILDLSREHLRTIHVNCAVSGSWSHHCTRMALDMHLHLHRRVVRAVVYGTGIGNPLLARQSLPSALDRQRECLDTLRRLYPVARIVLVGLPPVHDPYVRRCAPEYEFFARQWVMSDRDACLVRFGAKFSTMAGLPRIDTSSDGIHLSHEGGEELERLLEAAVSGVGRVIE